MLSTRGNQIVDASGRPVRLKAVSWFGAELPYKAPQGLWQEGYAGLLDRIRQWGFNCIRLPFASSITSDPPTGYIDPVRNPDLFLRSSLAVLDRIIDAAGERGLCVVLDLHIHQAGNERDGAPVAGRHTLRSLVGTWQFMARRYGSRPNVIGADVFNEPYAVKWPEWKRICETVGNAVHGNAPHWLIFVEGCDAAAGFWAGGNLTEAGANPVVLNQPRKLVYSPHEYGHSVHLMDWLQRSGHPVPAWPRSLFARFRSSWGYLFEQDIAPIWVGEFGGHFGMDGAGRPGRPHGGEERQWLQALASYLNGDFNGDGRRDLAPGKEGMSFAYWCLNPTSGDTGGLLQDDWTTAQAAKLEALAPLLRDGGNAVVDSTRGSD
nr:glycoside hydrolase family 5 protein [Pararoseomonas baculiformis]